MTSPSDKPDNRENSGLSPVIGIIMLVAITVALAGVIGFFATEMTQNQGASGVADVETEKTSDGNLKVQLHQKGPNTERINVVVDGTVEDTLSEVGESTTIDETEDISYVSVSDGGKENIIQSDVEDSVDDSNSSTSTPTATPAPSYDTAPSNTSEVLNNMDGSGTCSDPYVVTNVYELQAIDEDRDACYELGNDIDASYTANWNPDGDSENEGFDPIATNSDPFTGTLDGNGHTITGLTIDRTMPLSNREVVGMFNTTTGTITNLQVENASVTKTLTYEGDKIVMEDYTGIIAGANGGEISKVSVTGYADGYIGVAGVTGLNASAGTVSNTTVDVTVKGEGGFAGIVGANYGTVKNAVSHGTMDQVDNPTQSAGGSYGAGLVAWNRGTIETSYSTAEVIVNSGYEDGSGGLLGVDSYGTVNNSYWDTESSGMTSSAGGTGLTTSEMQGSSAETNMTGFDFDTVWTTSSNEYPELQEKP